MTSHSCSTAVRAAVLGLAATAILAAQGCGSAESYGEALSDTRATNIGDILEAPGSFDGKTVKVEGEVVLECSTGCWLNLEQDGATIRVDLRPSGLAIPQRVGSHAAVEGHVLIRDRQPLIVGKGVQIL